MVNDFFINGKRAYEKFGLRMSEDFIPALLTPPPLKDFIENKSRNKNGKTVIYFNPVFDERDVTLTFTIEGLNKSDYKSKFDLFMAELKKGKVEIQVPDGGNEIYRLTYKSSSNFGINRQRTFSKISIKFNEPDPDNR